MYDEPLLFEAGSPGRRAVSLPADDLPPDVALPALEPELAQPSLEGLPELSELEVVRHFTRLSQWNFSIASNFYPLGSCTMKYNPIVNEWAARLPGHQGIHPLWPDVLTQGALALMHELEQMLAEVSGMDAVTLTPAAGAQGEFVGIKMVRAYHEQQGNPRKTVLIPASAHGTNPASSVLCGYRCVEVPVGRDGLVHVADVEARLDEDVAAVMITNPNTLGLFERDIRSIADAVHAKGGLVYIDGANMNALCGVTRPGDVGADVLHINLHKTFSTPHGGGGPGAGPVGVKKILEPFLPVPRVVRTASGFQLSEDAPLSIGRVRTFHGNFGMLVRAYTYMLGLGGDGITRMTERAVLNANYLRKKLEPLLTIAQRGPCLHECVFTDQGLADTGVKTMDIAKRLLDFGFHAPTIYFPLVVSGAMMIEPTETESRETLDAFVAAIERIVAEARKDPQLLKTAPHTTRVRRLDEVRAARRPVLRWRPAKPADEATASSGDPPASDAPASSGETPASSGDAPASSGETSAPASDAPAPSADPSTDTAEG
ncbi:MAG TPA: aminomethyl-transferring glycine dehydrogenase subunit GcvPB [Candidatus Binatia bacterium]